MRVFVVLFIILISVHGFSADSDESFEQPRFWSMVTDVPRDLKEWTLATFSSEGFPYLASTLGITAVMIPTDYYTWKIISDPAEDSSKLKSTFKAGDALSGGIFQAGAGALFLGVGILGDKKALKTAYEIGETVLSSGVVIQILKRATGRESPNSTDSPHKGGNWHSYPGEKKYTSNRNHYDAMPSGHLSSAAAVGSVILLNYSETPWVPYVIYPTIGFFMFGCVGNNIHWWSDYPIALATGYSFAKIIVDRHSGKKKENNVASAWNKPNWWVGPDEVGVPTLNLSWKF
jgi:hypothetical protein